MVRAPFAAIAFALLLSASAWAQPAASQPSAPLPDAEIAKLKAAEKPEQQALRAKLAGMGKIYFDSNMSGIYRIYSMNADGSDVKCLTSGPLGGQYPHVTKDGKKLTYFAGSSKDAAGLKLDSAFAKRTPQSLVFLADADGSNPKAIAPGSLPHFSHDGTRIAYSTNITHARDTKPAIYDLRTNTEKVLTGPARFTAGFPVFTPDGKSLIVSNGTAFVLPLNNEGNALADGAAPKLIVSGHPCNMEVSDDGKQMAWVVDTEQCFGSWLCGNAFATVTAKAVGAENKSFPLGWPKKSVNYYPEFSPDASLLAYSHADLEANVKSWEVLHDEEIYVAALPDCKATVRLTFNRGANRHPCWVKAK